MASALTADNLTALRAGKHQTKAYLSIVTPSTVGTARINQASFSNPVAQITIDTLSANFTTLVKAGMTFWVGSAAGLRDIYVGRVRKTPTSTILYAGEFSDGDSGHLNLATLENLADNLYITVVDSFALHPKYSRITFSGGVGTFFKDYDLAYDDETTTSNTPIALNIGEHQVGFVNTGTSLLTVSMAATSKAFSSGVTISSYSWAIGDGSFTVGSSSSSSWTATFPVGQRWISCTVTLSNGQTVTARRVVIAHDTSTNVPLDVVVGSDNRTYMGRNITFDTPTILPTTNIDDGTLAIFWEESTWNGATIATAITKFVGWVRQSDHSYSIKGRKGNYTMENALAIYDQLGFVSQQLTVASTPANWAEVVYQLAHMDYYLFYLLYWHTTLLTLFDFEPLGGYNSYKLNAFGSSAGSLTKALQDESQRLNANIGQDSAGTIRVFRSYHMLSQAERTALNDRMTTTENDVVDIQITRRFLPNMGRVEAYGWSYNGSVVTPYMSYALGKSRGEGGGVMTLDGQLVDTQAELNRRASNEIANANNPEPSLRIQYAGNYDVFDLPNAAFVPLDIPASLSPTGAALTGDYYPTQVDVVWGGKGDKIVTATVTKLTSGLNAPGEKIPVVVGNDIDPSDLNIPPYDPNTGGVIVDPDPYDYEPDPYGTGDPFPAPDDTEDNGQSVVYFWTDSYLCRLIPTGVVPTIELIFTVPDTNILITDAIVNANSPRLTTNPIDGELTLWVSVGELPGGGTLEGIYECTDGLAAVPTFTDLGGTPKRITLRQSLYTTQTVTACDHDAYNDFSGDTPDQTQTVNGNSSTPVSILGGVTGNQLVMQVEGLIDAGTYEYDAAFRSSDGWTTYERYNTFEIDGQLLRPANVTYNAAHLYTFNLRDVGGAANYDIRFLDPDASWGGNTGSWTVNTFEALTAGGVATSEDGCETWDVTSQSISGDDALNPDYGLDVCDYSYIAVASASNRFVVRLTPTGTSTLFVAGTPDNANATTNLVRIPYKTIAATPVANSDDEALHWVYGANAVETASTHSLWKGVLDTSIPVNSGETGITPTISSVKTINLGPNSLELYANDPKVMAGWFERLDASGGSHLLLTTTGGTSWGEPNTGNLNGSWVTWQDGQKLWMAGTDGNGNGAGLRYSPDRGVTVYDYSQAVYDTLDETVIVRGVRVVTF